ncbi:uncharacterized protein M6B38_114550 [Iris pallida]|uniref:Uncharacterized protein n=1 Tax=Iris pallida TaxID=29817 RepID=A0AAX6ICC7_IRIPA|nr:uncharacterized protein M6B38_114550 [Iris pallida]
MEEEKAAAYYEELCRKGEGAAKFKQGLGFSSSSSDPQKKSSFSSSSSLFSSFVRASSPKKLEEEERKRNHSQVLDKIRSQLNSSSAHDHHPRRRSDDDGGYRRGRGRDDRDRERSRSRDRDRERRRRSRSRSRDRDGDRKRRDRDGSSRRKDERGVDYSQIIDGYSKMAPAERVKAKMKFQLSQTAAKDTTMGMSTGWERFNFNKDAPLDEEEDDQVEVAADDSLIKGIGKSFRFSAVEAKREEELQAAHDQAMFGGASAASPVLPLEPIRTAEEDEKDDDKKVDSGDNHLSSSLMSALHATRFLARQSSKVSEWIIKKGPSDLRKLAQISLF